MRYPTLALLLALSLPAGPVPEDSGLERELAKAERALADGTLESADLAITRAMERDPDSVEAWNLEARLGAASGDEDRRIYALHRELGLRRAQGKQGVRELETEILAVDAVASELFGLKAKYTERLAGVAARYEKAGWPHAAIAVHRSILALDPDAAASSEAIERLAAAPDPSLAADARQVDLLAGISKQWIAEHDAEHATWKDRAKLERDNYVTETDAGYEVLVRAAEAMEQMNAFYRVFFQYGHEARGKKIPRIALRIFRTSEEYKELGSGPPVGWSAGQFTGGSVETYIGETGFEGMTGTLFHEAAHQFVSLATNAAGWLNEGLASFFEGSRILANGSVVTNEPASHRLFPLAARLERGWMRSSRDGITEDPKVTPERAPTFRIVLENDYEWGPPWYAPTWGVVYFLYNFQDPADGRFVYRAAFREYVDRSGGLTGDTAVEVFEEVVLGNPAPATRGVSSSLALPTSVDELSDLWKSWLLALRDEQSGKLKPERPYLSWAESAIERGAAVDAQEFFEKGLRETPEDPELLFAFGSFLAEERDDQDRAVKLLRHTARILELTGAEEERVKETDRRLRQLDPERKKLAQIHADLAVDALAPPQRYLDAGLPRMALDVAGRLGRELELDGMPAIYEAAVRELGSTNARWRLAYNGEDLQGWNRVGQDLFRPDGPNITARFEGEPGGNAFAYRFLSLDVVTSGDYSLETEIQVIKGQVTYAGIVFGQKTSANFHGIVLFPPDGEKKGYADLASFYGDNAYDTWRHEPVFDADAVNQDTAGKWHRLRIDIVGNLVDMWVDGKHLATQEFASRSVLRGRFGLMCGVGQARFRNVRYLARDANDPAAGVERRIRMGPAIEAAAPAAAAAGGEGPAAPTGDVVDVSSNGSWIGLRPPFPSALTWFQGERSSWFEKRGSPQLLVLWSCDQNDSVRIDAWLRALDEKYGKLGLEIVNVLHTWDLDRGQAYLEKKPFPGVVCVDARNGNESLGVTFSEFAVDRFHLPRLVLVDVDGRVAWEGAPGFSAGSEWSGESSFLDTPLESLAAKRNLKALGTWRAGWRAAKDALLTGDFDAAWPVIAEAAAFDASAPEVAEAQRMRADVERALADFDATWSALEAELRVPAALELVAWAKAMGTPVDKKLQRAVEKHAESKAWEKALGYLKPSLRKIDEGKDPAVPERVLERMGTLEGRFVTELHTDVADANADPAALTSVCRSAAGRPARWLAEEHFGW